MALFLAVEQYEAILVVDGVTENTNRTNDDTQTDLYRNIFQYRTQCWPKSSATCTSTRHCWLSSTMSRRAFSSAKCAKNKSGGEFWLHLQPSSLFLSHLDICDQFNRKKSGKFFGLCPSLHSNISSNRWKYHYLEMYRRCNGRDSLMLSTDGRSAKPITRTICRFRKVSSISVLAESYSFEQVSLVLSQNFLHNTTELTRNSPH